MHQVVWTDEHGKHHELECDGADCRDLFRIVVAAAIRGKCQDVLLIDPSGNFLDTWGT